MQPLTSYLRVRAGRFMPSLTRVFLAGVALASMAAFAGCGGKPQPILLADVSIDNLAGVEPQIGSSMRVATRIQQNATFPAGKLELAMEYAKWFERQGWKRASQREEVSLIEYRFIKDPHVATVRFSTDSGVALEMSRPADATAAGAQPPQ